MRILHVCSEMYPILKTGGLADVTGALPNSLAQLGCESRVLLPGFPSVRKKISNKTLVTKLPNWFGLTNLNLYYGSIESNFGIYIIDAPDFYDREGNPYADKDGVPYADNYKRFALLGYVAAKLAEGFDYYWKPQVVHGHDWHAGLTFAYLKAYEISTGYKLAGSVFTVHNLAYQGAFPGHIFSELMLPDHFFNMNGVEFYSNISYMKAGLFFADKLTTVSPSYALEIQQEEQGCGLNGLLSNRRYDLWGILNGVDPLVWDPETDTLIAENYNSRALTNKTKCKLQLQKLMKIDIAPESLLFVVVSRLTEQKGLHLVLGGLHKILELGGQLIVLGSGDSQIEQAFSEMARQYPKSIAVKLGYDEAFAHQLIAGGDVILVPSRFEPCGLTQLYGMLYGTLPLVHKVGGLADSVKDVSLENLFDGIASGFVFDDFNQNSFDSALRRSVSLYSRKSDWKKVQKYAMQQDFSWNIASGQFLKLYQQVAVN